MVIRIELLDNVLYQEDLRYVAKLPLNWDKLAGKTVLISGAAGMIGSFITDVLMYKNTVSGLDCHVCALGRSEEKARKRFCAYLGGRYFHFYSADINMPIQIPVGPIEYVLHLASNTHPIAYANDPVGTITTNIIGTYNLLELAAEKGARITFTSSVEVYGENRGDADRFTERYCGYIDCNTVRAGYPESKRCGEALCQAYIAQKSVDAVIPRLPRTFGPTMQMSDTKAIAQFIKNGVAGEDIVLKSEGTQLYSYGYVADVAAGILTCMLKGKKGEVYNIADESCDITLRDLADMIAVVSGTNVVFRLPDEIESAGYSKATKAVLSGGKIKELGHVYRYDMRGGIERTIRILREMNV